MVAIKDNKDYIRAIILLLCHYYRVRGPLKVLWDAPWMRPQGTTRKAPTTSLMPKGVHTPATLFGV